MAEGWTVHQAVLVFSVMSLTALGLESCPPPCSCRLGSDEVHVLDCSRKKLSVPPLDLPDGITHVSLNHNDLIAVPYLGDVTSNITSLSLVHNRISELATLLLQPYVSLETLDLSSNSLSEIKAGAFPSMQLKYLNLSNNKISLLEPGCFDNISSSLLVLRLNRNRIALLPYKVFRLPRLQLLEFKRNKIKMVDSLTFKGMEALKTLKMQRNGITKLMDGAFFGLNNIEELELEHNNLTEVNKGWLYGLRRLRLLRISHNSLTLVRPDSWEFCHNLEELDLSFNHMSRLEGTALAGLAQLQSLNLGDNALTHLGEGAFSSLASLRTLDIRNNEISWAIEDSVGVFVGMKKLTTLILQRNKIKSITKKAFDGLDELEHLDLSKNGIMSIHPEAVAHMHLKEFLLNSSSLLCDCLLQWLSPWLSGQPFQGSVRAVCAHPPPLQGQSLLEVAPGLLLCDDFPKPLITTHPESSTVLRGTNVTLSCLAASSSDSPMAAAWRRDGELLYEPEVQTYARFQDGQLLHSSLLHLLHVNFTDEGRYQCVVSNHFGSNYSNRARLTVNELPSFLKTPMDLTLRTGTMARLECAAEGHPAPQIAWQKDGGTDFPAARERRMHVMPDDDIFFIANVKTEDMGVYSCTAQNTAGSLSANATLTVLETPSLLRPLEDRVVARGETAVLQCIAGGSPAPRINWTKDDGPLVLTERHFFAAANQLLIIVEAGPGDAGRYTCSMSNTLGTERGQVYLGVAPQAGCEAGDADGWATVGIVVMVVVSCVVGTSLVWVIVIYHMRRRGEDYSITNTDELTLPADIPSYLSSQGTLSEPVEGYSNSEAGSHQQLMPPLSNTHTHKGTDGVCYGDTGSEVEVEPSRGSSLFTSSFYPGETEGLGGGAAGPLVTCSDCYDNGSMYSRPRESCPFPSEEDALEQALPPRPPGGPHYAPRHTPDSSQDPSLCRGAGGAGGHPQHSCSAEVSSRSFWAEGRDPTLQAPPQPPGPRGAPPPGLASGEGPEEGGAAPNTDYRSASYRTNSKEETCPT